MGTRCLIGMGNVEDGIIKYVYCHYDGYPEWTGDKLLEHYNDPGKVAALLELGDFSQLKETLEETREDSYHHTREEPVVVGHAKNLKDYTEHFKDSWCEYAYLFVTTEGWYCAEMEYVSGETKIVHPFRTLRKQKKVQ